jgi:beta-barrel assembly-enhancing protease
MTYKALAYNEKYDDGREAGEIKIIDDKLIFFNNNIEQVIDRANLKIELGGTANRHIFINDTTTDTKLSCADMSLLKSDFFKYNTALAQRSKAIADKKQLNSIVLYGAIILFAAGIFGVILGRKSIVKTLAKGVPTSVEEGLGSAFVAQLKLTSKVDTVSEAFKILNKKVNLLTSKVEGNHQFKTFIVEADEVNAFALPGGYMVFNSALLKKADSWEEVLGVASHEIAHVTENHHTRGVLSKVGIFTILSLMLGDGSALTDILFGAGASLEGLSYSRDFETEADVKGFEYLLKSNINPKGLRIFFSKLEKENKIGSAIPEFVSTHPSNENRIQEIQKLENTQGKNRNYITIEDYSIFRNKIKTVSK